ncbi:Ltp family lipoprotein [Staphylococcus auricularis]|uniref:Ltp family lipoprotein n=1 Tax=Staphylococcus auricularis TaxID=29379 RepID=A0AAW7MC54_9STAP|nr:Ltp family lipoprotein [Staphylococcus auricularis]MDC6327005.1 Ltp family lipoprotein [Staphylococcus auricularis]MDN4532882.1 Ltp family lipoprotein [Staphylococcus auricularis]HJE01871.1 Ltp family lipoprotein [Staphylococcus auricularis]
MPEKQISNEELLRQQQRQFEEYKEQQRRSITKKWLWGCGGCLLFVILMGILFSACTAVFVNTVDKDLNEVEVVHDKDKSSKSNTSNISNEKKAALKSAKNYSKTMHMSKEGIYRQLTSEFDKFSEEDAQYAVDHLKADYKENALKTAKNYRNTLNMSTDTIYNQLISDAGNKFTEEEAQYAIDHLDK